MRVLVINSQDTLSGGVVSLLSREEDLEIIDKEVAGKSDLVSALEELQPEAVIMNDSLLFTYPATILRLLRSYPELQVIVLDEDQNLIHLYTKLEVVVERASDLISLIRRN